MPHNTTVVAELKISYYELSRTVVVVVVVVLELTRIIKSVVTGQ